MIAKEPQKYGFTDLDYQKPLKYEVVKVPTATDLEVVAESCGVSYERNQGTQPRAQALVHPPGSKELPGAHSLRHPGRVREKIRPCPREQAGQLPAASFEEGRYAACPGQALPHPGKGHHLPEPHQNPQGAASRHQPHPAPSSRLQPPAPGRTRGRLPPHAARHLQGQKG